MSGTTHGFTPLSMASRKCTIWTRAPFRYISSADSTDEFPAPTTSTSWSKNG